MILEIASFTVTTYTVLLKTVIFNWRWPVAMVECQCFPTMYKRKPNQRKILKDLNLCHMISLFYILLIHLKHDLLKITLRTYLSYNTIAYQLIGY